MFYYICITQTTKYIMKHLILLQNQSLNDLSNYFGLSTNEFSEKLFLGWKNNIDDDLCDNEDAGQSLNDVVESIGYKTSVFMAKVFGKSNNYICEKTKEIIFMHESGECEVCGHELNHENDGCDGYEWTETNCTNCDFSTTNEPDWDCMSGGEDDY